MGTNTLTVRAVAKMAVLIAFLVGLAYAQEENYLLFHSLVELACIIIAGAIFAIVWNTRRLVDNGFILFMGVVYLFVAVLDMLHLLAYRGMGVFASSGPNLAAQLWIAARYVASVSLLIAPALALRRLRPEWIMAAFTLVVSALILSIFQWRNFPTCYVDPSGPLTPFKIVSEYIIITLYLGAIGTTLHIRRLFDRRVWALLIASFAAKALGEWMFTLYNDPTAMANAAGHYCKLLSFYLAYKALIEIGLRQPYDVLFHQLSQSEQQLRGSHSELERRVRERTTDLKTMVETLQAEVNQRRTVEQALTEQSRLLDAFFQHAVTPVAFMDRHFNFVRVNQAYADATRRRVEEFAGHNLFELLGTQHESAYRQAIDTRQVQQGLALPFRFPGHPQWGVVYWDWALVPILNAQGQVELLVLSLKDVTDRTLADQKLREERQRLYAVLQMLPGYVSLHATDYTIRFANNRFIEWIGDPKGRPCYEVVRGRSAPCPDCHVQQILQTGVPMEWEWTSSNGKSFHTWGFPFSDGADSPHLVLELGTDISERRLLEGEVLKASELERQSIGRDLHDSLGQMLGGVACLSQALQQKLQQQRLPEALSAAKIVEVISDAVRLTRSLARGMSPVGIQSDTLEHSLKNLARNVESLFTIHCSVECKISCEPAADSMVGTHLYRIAQESINNAVRHGKARNVSIRLSGAEDSLSLAIEDDGVGVPTKRASGMGLRIMNYRANTIGAELSIRRRSQGGTIVVCQMHPKERHR